MSVDVSPFEIAVAEAGAASLRAVGFARLSAEHSAGATTAIEIEERGPLRLRFPRIVGGSALECVLVNTGGGIAGGDRLEIAVEAGEGAAVAVTSQAAEKIYRSDGAIARISLRLHAAPRARLAWLPQETILFDRARMERTIDAEIAADASLTICESVVFGRTAMDERVRAGVLRDRWRVRRAGRLVFADALTLDGAIAGILERRAIAAGAVATATLVHVAPDAESKIDVVRAALERDGIEAGASVFDGLLVARLIAQDAADLRAAILNSLAALGATPPRAFNL
jgi:urease accessory protein